jgi:hypothetical protein
MYGHSGEMMNFQPSHKNGFPMVSTVPTSSDSPPGWHVESCNLCPQDVADCRACWRRRRWKGRWAQRSSGNTCSSRNFQVSSGFRGATWFRHGEGFAVLMVKRSVAMTWTGWIYPDLSLEWSKRYNIIRDTINKTRELSWGCNLTTPIQYPWKYQILKMIRCTTKPGCSFGSGMHHGY